MYLCFGIAIYLFINIELIRQELHNKCWIVEIFDKKIRRFTDERDNEKMIVTHIYLLIGCGYPFLVLKGSFLLKLSGILILGVGDSFAAIIGKYYGTHNLPYTNKTVQGLFACFFSI